MSNELKFRISEVATLTGITIDSIRAWEKRYGAVTPSRDSVKARLYSQDDVTRLKYLKRLVDRGARISDIAKLDKETLAARLSQQDSAHTKSLRTAIPVALIGPDLKDLFDSMPGNDFRLIAECENLDDWGDAYIPAGTTIVIRYDVAAHDRLKRLIQGLFATDPRMVVLLYQFAPSEFLDDLRKRGVLTVRTTSDTAELKHALLSKHYWDFAGRDDAQGFLNEPIPAPRLSDADLGRARQMTADLACECPKHLAELIGSLKSFETYSAQCESMTPEDAATHAMLRSASGHARAIMESALLCLAKDDGLLDQLLGTGPAPS